MSDNSGNAIEILLKFIIDSSSEKAAKDAIDKLNKAGVSTGAGANSGAIPSGASTDYIQTAQAIKEVASRLNISIERAAELVDLGGKTKEQVMADVAAYEQMAQAAQQAVSAAEKIAAAQKDVATATEISTKQSVAAQNIYQQSQNLATKASALHQPDIAKQAQDAGKVATEAQVQSQQASQQAQDVIEKIAVARKALEEGKAAEAEQAAITAQTAAKEAVASSEAASARRQTAQEQLSAARQEESLQQSLKRAQSMAGFSGFLLSMTGMSLERAGQALLSPMQQYIQFAGEGQAASAAWLSSQQQIQESEMRIGAVMAQEIQPGLQKLADLSSQVADFAEKHPDAVKAVAAIATGGVALGGLMVIVGQTVAGISALQTFLKMSGAGTAVGKVATGVGGALSNAGTAALGFMAGTGGAITLGAGAGVAGYNAIAAQKGWESAGQVVGQTLTVLAFKAGQLFGADKASEWGSAIGRLTGQIDNLANASDKASGSGMISQDVLNAYIAYKQQESQAEQQYEQQRSDIVRQYGEQRAEIEEQYERTRAQAIRDNSANQARQARDLNQSLMQEEQDYYQQRAKLAENYQIDVQRAEEDHQRQLRQLQEDHNARMEELTANRDALGMIREMNTYERDRQRSEEEYQVQSRRRSEDFARQIAEMEGNFAQQRAQRLQQYAQQRADQQADFAQRLADMDAEHKVEMDKATKQEQEKLSDLDQQNAQDRQKRMNAFNDQLRDLNAALLGERNVRNAYYQAMSADLQAWLKSMAGQFGSNLPGYPSRQVGGYVDYGLYQMHPHEFVLTDQTTSIFERAASGRLTQQKVISMLLSGGGGGNGQVVWNDNRKFDSRLSMEDRETIRQDTLKTLAGAFA